MDNSPERLLRLFTKAPHAFWRHDVDVSLSAAVKMARFAQLAGVKGTYFLWPRSPYYNLFSREGAEAVDVILEAGHCVGLHVDYRNGSVYETVRRDTSLMMASYGYSVGRIDPTRVSFHMPPDCVLWRDFGGFESAYASKWEGRYLADSRGEFGPEKEARLDEMVADGGPIQLNLHSEHWNL